MRDLAVLHLANKATVEQVIRLGSVKEVQSYRIVGSEWRPFDPGTSVVLEENVDSSTVSITKDGSQLRPYAGDFPIPLGSYYFDENSGPEGEDRVLFAEAPSETLRITYSTITESAYEVFELRGVGMQFTTAVRIGSKVVDDITILSDSVVRIKVPLELVPSVIIENVRVLVSLDSTPLASDVIFDLSTRSKAATGTEIVTQRFLTILLAPDGGNLEQIVPKNGSLTPQFRTVIINRVSLAVNVTRAKMRRATPKDAPAEETLAGAFVNGVSFNQDGSADVDIKLVTLAGFTATAPLTVGV